MLVTSVTFFQKLLVAFVFFNFQRFHKIFSVAEIKYNGIKYCIEKYLHSMRENQWTTKIASYETTLNVRKITNIQRLVENE